MGTLGTSQAIFTLPDCNMRKSFDGFCGPVITVMGRRPTSGEIFVF